MISGKCRGTTDTPVMDKQGKLLTTEAEQDARWAEHFSEVLNRPPPPTAADVQEAETDLDVTTKGEVKALQSDKLLAVK